MSIFIQKPNIVARQIAGETLLVPISGNLADMQKLFAVQDVGALIWEKLNGRNDEEQICDAIVTKFDIDKESARKDFLRFIDELQTAGLIEKQ